MTNYAVQLAKMVATANAQNDSQDFVDITTLKDMEDVARLIIGDYEYDTSYDLNFDDEDENDEEYNYDYVDAWDELNAEENEEVEE